VFTGLDEFGCYIAGFETRKVIRHLKRDELREYCLDYPQVIPDDLGEQDDFQYTGDVARNIRRRLI
jgi:hypothetical protein